MNFAGLDLLFLEVNSLDETIHFYRDLLGFEISKFDPESDPPMVTFRAGELRITFAQHLETMLRRGRGVSFFIGVDDVDSYHNTLSRELELSPPIDEGWGGRFITLEDPDKYRLFFVTWAGTPAETPSQSSE
jgi:catechol 2,3-dioxygenase-like lactoylglutathione lyase family enzyme